MPLVTLSSGVIRFAYTGLDLTATSSVRITPSFGATKKFIVDRIQLVITAKSGTLTIAPTLGMGTDSGASNLVAFSNAIVTTSAAADDVFVTTLVVPHTGARVLCADLSTANGAGGGIVLAITTAASGSGLVLTCDVHVTGYFVS